MNLQTNKSIKKILCTSTFIIFLCVFFGTVAIAANDKYVPLSPLPSIAGSSPTNSSSDFSGYVIQLYQWGVALTSGLAVVVIMWGGVGYVTSAGGGGIEEAKGRISAAIMGLLLALSSYIILKTINQDLLNVNFNLDPLPVSTGGNTGGASGDW
jgi:hypothetical protein